MIEETLQEIKEKISLLDIRIDRLSKHIIPKVEDISKYLKEAKQLTNKGKHPRRQPKAVKSARQAFESK